MEVLRIEGLTKRYGRIKAIDQLSLTVHSGQVMGLLGPNGSGKTTTLGIILDILKADAGTYRWFEGKYAAADARKRIGSILERPYFYPHLSADENLEIVRRIKDLPPMSFDEVLDTVGLLKRRHSPYRTYSLGMKQRLAVASTLLGDPEVLIFDEPTNGLDPEGIIEMREIVDEVGVDAARYFFIMRKLDSPLDFDIELAKKQTDENPVFYVQYAQFRLRSPKHSIRSCKKSTGYSTSHVTAPNSSSKLARTSAPKRSTAQPPSTAYGSATSKSAACP